MSDKPPFYALPGFFPDAIPYALRTAAALVLAYGVGFYAQLPTASSAGITVGIIAQPSAGMALSKAFYRILGTVIGCIVSLVLGAAFGQDRTMLLAGFAVWMGLCAGAATILRDFRSYGAALSGYTVAIIAIGGIDDPDGLLLASLNRTAAIVLGIASVALVNSLFGGVSALDGLIASLHTERDRVSTFAIDALEGRPIDNDHDLVKRVANITKLQTEATYAAAEKTGGRRRRQGAQVTIGSLLTAVSAGRTIAGLLTPETDPVIRDHLRAVAAALRDGSALPAAPPTREPFDALLIERAHAIHRRMHDADCGLDALDGGKSPLPTVVLRPTHDIPAALIGGFRSVIAFGLTAAFGVLGGWSGATLMLIQQAAFVGLLAAVPTPTQASTAFLLPLLPIALIVGIIEFQILPLTSGFVPFALIVGGLMFATGVAVRHKKLAPFAGAAFIYVTLLLSPSNPQTYDLGTFLNTTLLVFMAVVFTLLTFLLIIPVSPKRRLYRVVVAVGQATHRARLSRDKPQEPAVAQARLYDRLGRALTFLGKPTVARQSLLSDIYSLGASDIALHRARTGLDALDRPEACLEARPAIQTARDALVQRDFTSMMQAATALLAIPGLWPGEPAEQAVSGLADLAYQEGPRHRVTRFYDLMMH